MVKDRNEYFRQYREKNKEKINAYQRAYYKKNKEKLLACYRKYQTKNKEKILQYKKEYREKNKKAILAYRKKRYHENIEQEKKWAKTYRTRPEYKSQRKKHDKKYLLTTNGKMVRARNEEKRRAKKAKCKQVFTKEEWFAKVKATQGICPSCKKKVGIRKLTMDHIIPLSKAPEGSTYTIYDVEPICQSCNSKKRANISDKTKFCPVFVNMMKQGRIDQF